MTSYHLEKEEGGSLEIGRPRSKGSKNIGRRWTRGMGGLENWTIFMDVIRVSSLILLPLFSAENILNSRLESTKWQLNIVSSKP